MYSSVKLGMYNWVTLWYVQFSGTWFIQFSMTWNVRFRSNLYEQFGKTLAYTIQLNLVLATKTQCRSIHFLALHKKMISLSTTSTTITTLTATTTTTTTSAATTTTSRRTKTRCKQVSPLRKFCCLLKIHFFTNLSNVLKRVQRIDRENCFETSEWSSVTWSDEISPLWQ